MIAKTVPAYITQAPAPMRASLKGLGSMIRAAMPGARESISENGFPVYADKAGNWVAGFAWRKKGPMLYIMTRGVLDRHEEKLGRLRSGRSCIEWRASKALSMDELSSLAKVMLAEAAARI